MFPLVVSLAIDRDNSNIIIAATIIIIVIAGDGGSYSNQNNNTYLKWISVGKIVKGSRFASIAPTLMAKIA